VVVVPCRSAFRLNLNHRKWELKVDMMD